MSSKAAWGYSVLRTEQRYAGPKCTICTFNGSGHVRDSLKGSILVALYVQQSLTRPHFAVTHRHSPSKLHLLTITHASRELGSIYLTLGSTSIAPTWLGPLPPAVFSAFHALTLYHHLTLRTSPSPLESLDQTTHRVIQTSP